MTVVRRADLTDLDAVTSVVAGSCHQSALAAWLIADTAERPRVLNHYVGAQLRHDLRYGHAWTIDLAAVAVWRPCRTATGAAAGDRQPWLDLASGPHANRFRLLTSVLDSRHPTDPHQHLTALAVAADRQRQGLGTGLLHHCLLELEAAGRPAYAEAHSVGLRRLLVLHGFRDDGPPIDIPDGPRLWPMTRWQPLADGPCLWPTASHSPAEHGRRH